MNPSLSKLKSLFEEGKAIPFIGAGVSRAVKNKNNKILDEHGNFKDFDCLFPSWKELLLKAVEELIKKQRHGYADLVKGYLNIDKPDYLEAARFARTGLRGDWVEFLKESLDPDPELIDADSLKLAKDIWELGSPFIITTNYDNVLRWACPKPEKLSFWEIQNTAELALLRKKGFPLRPTVWHLHGHIDNSANIILAPDEYQKLYPENNNIKPLYEASLDTFRSLLTQFSFVFIGCSMRDENIVSQLRSVQAMYDNGTPTHYVIVYESERERINSLEMNLEIICYE